MVAWGIPDFTFLGSDFNLEPLISLLGLLSSLLWYLISYFGKDFTHLGQIWYIGLDSDRGLRLAPAAGPNIYIYIYIYI